jgi:hypothetical protein
MTDLAADPELPINPVVSLIWIHGGGTAAFLCIGGFFALNVPRFMWDAGFAIIEGFIAAVVSGGAVIMWPSIRRMFRESRRPSWRELAANPVTYLAYLEDAWMDVLEAVGPDLALGLARTLAVSDNVMAQSVAVDIHMGVAERQRREASLAELRNPPEA